MFSFPHCPRPPPLPTQQGHTVRWQKTPQTQQVAGPLLERWAKPAASSVTPGTPFSKSARRYFQASLEVPGDGARCLYCVHVCTPARDAQLGEGGWGRAGRPGTARAEQPDHPTTRQSSGETEKTASSPQEAGTYTDAVLTSGLGLAIGMQFSKEVTPSSAALLRAANTQGQGRKRVCKVGEVFSYYRRARAICAGSFKVAFLIQQRKNRVLP